MEKEKRRLSIEEAVRILLPGETVHTFRAATHILVGADWDREKLISYIEKHQATLEVSGDTAREMKHGLVLVDEAGPLFIETDEVKLNEIDPDKVYRMSCNKITYASFKEAQTVVNNARKPRYYGTKRLKRRQKDQVPVRSYHCEKCNGWHLTSMEKKKTKYW